MQVQGLTSDVTSGGSGHCAIKKGGVPWCRQDPPRGDALRADPVPGVKDAVQVVGTAHFGCALDAGGGVKCWGTTPQLYSGPEVNPEAITITGLPEGVVQIDALQRSHWIGTAPQRLVMRLRDGRALVLGGLGLPASERPAIQTLEGGARVLAADGSGGRITLDGRIGPDSDGMAQLASAHPDLTDGTDPITDLSLISGLSQWGCVKRESGAVNCWNNFDGDGTNLLGDGSTAARLDAATPLGYEGLSRLARG